MCRRKRSFRFRKIRRTVAAFLVLMLLCLIWFEAEVKAQLRDIIVREMLTLSEQAVNSAVELYLNEHPDIGEHLTSVAYGGAAVSAITTNSAYINLVKTEVTQLAQEKISELAHRQGVSAHLGSFTGLVFLTNIGPTVRFDVDSSQTVSCEFNSTFEGAGLNQTVHHITMTVYVDLLIYNPFRVKKTVSTSSTFEIAQTVIVGAVPSYGGMLTY